MQLFVYNGRLAFTCRARPSSISWRLGKTSRQLERDRCDREQSTGTRLPYLTESYSWVDITSLGHYVLLRGKPTPPPRRRRGQIDPSAQWQVFFSVDSDTGWVGWADSLWWCKSGAAAPLHHHNRPIQLNHVQLIFILHRSNNEMKCLLIIIKKWPSAARKIQENIINDEALDHEKLDNNEVD